MNRNKAIIGTVGRDQECSPGRPTGPADQPDRETMYQLRQGTRDLVVRLVPESVRRSLRRKRRREPVVGRPPGLDSELLEGIFEEATGAKMGAVSHLQISGWRKPSSGTFRVFVDTTDGGKWSVIFKNAVLTSDETPGISGLPAKPGMPEYLIYRRGSEYLRPYLPLPFVVREIEPKVHYQYLLEDLQSSGFHSAFADADVIRAATALPDLHKHMETWVSHDDDSLIRYGAAFSADLRRMTRRSFERYTDAVPDRSVVDVLENWESIAQVHSEAIQHEQTLEVPIHGDANRANLLVHDDHDLPLKLVDWEWAGVGLPHSDLASLLKGKRDGVTEEGVRAFAAGYPQLSLADHRRLHYWARIETRFFDASYMINQYLASPDTSRMDLPRYIHVSAGDIVKTAKRIDS
jgi:hypothetical protein